MRKTLDATSRSRRRARAPSRSELPVSVGRASGRIAMTRRYIGATLSLQQNPHLSPHKSRLLHGLWRDPRPLEPVEQHRELGQGLAVASAIRWHFWPSGPSCRARISMMDRNSHVPFKGRIQKRKTYCLRIILPCKRAAGPYRSASSAIERCVIAASPRMEPRYSRCWRSQPVCVRLTTPGHPLPIAAVSWRP